MSSLDYIFDTAVPYDDNDVDSLVENGHISNEMLCLRYNTDFISIYFNL